MTAYYNNKRQSLVEKKKQQWAKEREELDSLTMSTWGINPSFNKYSKTSIRTKYQSNSSIKLRDSNETLNESKRRPSLPPIYDNPNITKCSYMKIDQEVCTETSGYGSDSANQSTPEYFSPQEGGDADSISSNRSDERQKWIDSTIKIRHIWEPPQEEYDSKTDTPGWLRRGLQRNCEIMVATQSPENEITDHEGNERPYTSSSSTYRTHIRGQNVPLEPIELAERERRRQIALDHQNAIKAQLEEREQRRKDEKQKRLKEEAEEELRIRREQEIEDERLETEAQRKKEKLEIEQKRNAAMREALEIAEREAKKEKSKQKICKQLSQMQMETPRTEDEATEVANNDTATNYVTPAEETGLFATNSSTVPSEEMKQVIEIEPIIVKNITDVQKIDPNDTNITAITATQGIENFPNLQFAMIVPSLNLGPSVPIAVPVILSTDRYSTQDRTENRVLTPSVYRLKIQYSDSSTQTDFPEQKLALPNSPEKAITEKMEKLEVHYDNHIKRDKRQQTEDGKPKDSLEDRPKWGVNRPPTRYVKQSEKDPLYQRRKLRQKNRQPKIKRYSPHSSDDSAISPRPNQIAEYNGKRKSRSLWRKQEKITPKIGMFQTEIVPLESDKDQIYCKSSSSGGFKSFYERSYTEQDNEINILTIKHPRSSRSYSEKSSKEDSKILEDLQRLKNGLIQKQAEWESFPLHNNSRSATPNSEIK